MIKVDADYVLVNMNESEHTPNNTNVLENSRIFQKSQLQLVRPPLPPQQQQSSQQQQQCSTIVKFPDFNQKYLKKLSGLSEVLAVAAHTNTVHAIVKKENASIMYVQYDMTTGKVNKERRLSTSSVTASFLGHNMNSIVLYPIDSVEFPMMPLLTDGNATLYPLLDVSGVGQLKEPLWKQTFPLKCFSHYVMPNTVGKDTTESTSKKATTTQIVSILVVKIQPLIASILRYDVKRVGKILKQLDSELAHNQHHQSHQSGLPKRIRRVLLERIDGNRNIIHAAVFACAPTSNKTYESGDGFSNGIFSRLLTFRIILDKDFLKIKLLFLF